jgi:hypothetical protein
LEETISTAPKSKRLFTSVAIQLGLTLLAALHKRAPGRTAEDLEPDTQRDRLVGMSDGSLGDGVPDGVDRVRSEGEEQCERTAPQVSVSLSFLRGWALPRLGPSNP